MQVLSKHKLQYRSRNRIEKVNTKKEIFEQQHQQQQQTRRRRQEKKKNEKKRRKERKKKKKEERKKRKKEEAKKTKEANLDGMHINSIVSSSEWSHLKTHHRSILPS